LREISSTLTVFAWFNTSSRSKFMSTGRNGFTNGGLKSGDARCAKYREKKVVEGTLVGCNPRDDTAAGEEGGSDGVAQFVTLDVRDGATGGTGEEAARGGRKVDVHMG
jgi:hypothetical protein